MSGFNGLKLSIIGQLMVIVTFLIVPADSYAKAGCCSRHGGVAGCDSSTGRQLCKDGSTSPSCACDGSSVAPVKPGRATKTKPVAPAETVTPAASVAATPAKSTKGCCARHGGVGQCNTSTGYLMCKDGTQSGSCKC